jgi:hypothetical protein
MKNSGNMKKKTIQVAIVIALTFAFVGMLIGTEVYAEVHNGIVSVLCLSCIKLDPVTSADFTFETATDEDHPNFIIENLTEGIVFLHFSGDACHACEVMHPVIEEIFNITFSEQDMLYKRLQYQNITLNYYFTNIDHAVDYRIKSFFTYDKEHIEGLPMFTIMTINYDRGIVKPYYTSLYGILNLDTNEERLAFLQDVLDDSIQLWNENIPGFEP